MLPATCSPEELQSVAEVLLHAAPRVPVQGSARLNFGQQGGEPRMLNVENISSTGMFLKGTEPPPVGSVFGFELTVAGQNAPIRGQAQVVRHTPTRNPGEHGVAATFLSFGGDGAMRIESLVFQERAATGAKGWRTPSGSMSVSGIVDIRDADELALRKEELAELAPFLEGLLQQGLAPRVRAAEWYVAAAELGLESLRAFAAILEAVHGGRTKRSEVSQQLADLSDVSRSLASFGQAKDVQSRVQLLLGMRLSLERLMRELAVTGAGSEPGAAGKPLGLVAQLNHDIQRLLRSRKVLRQLPPLIAQLRFPHYLFTPAARARRAEEICRDYANPGADIRLVRERLLTRRGRNDAITATHRELKRLDQRLAAVHKKIYGDKFRKHAIGDIEADFEEQKLMPILGTTLAAGAEFLTRAYSAYRHALELTGSDVRLLDRVAGLAAAVTAAEERLKKAAAAQRR
jgi:hypothetical protein